MPRSKSARTRISKLVFSCGENPHWQWLSHRFGNSIARLRSLGRRDDFPYVVAESAAIESGGSIGPFARLRPGTPLRQDTHIGNFVELKNTVFAAGAKAGHLAYLGDSDIGAETNIGAGTITCNYDGAKKHRTPSGTNSLSEATLPWSRLSDRGMARTSERRPSITKSVEADALAIGRAHQDDEARLGKEKKGEQIPRRNRRSRARSSDGRRSGTSSLRSATSSPDGSSALTIARSGRNDKRGRA